MVILGSATPPSLESYHLALQGGYELVRLTKRVEERPPLPQVEVVDMRREFEAGNRSMFSRALRQELAALEGTAGQAIILLNRRGLFQFCFMPGMRACDAVPPQLPCFLNAA